MKTLFLMEWDTGLGTFTSGGLQRTEHIYESLLDAGECHIYMISEDPEDDISFFADDVIKKYNIKQVLHFDRRNVEYSGFQSPSWLPRKIRSYLESVDENRLRLGYSVDLNHKVRSIISQGRYDLVVSRYLYPSLVTGLSRRKNCPVILDLDDDPLERRYWKRKRENSQRSLKQWFIAYRVNRDYKKNIRDLIAKHDHVWFVKKDDADRYGIHSFSVLFNIPPSQVKKDGSCANDYPQDTGRRNILFVGLLSYAPNYLGLKHFLDKSWSEILRNEPGAFLSIVGGGLTGNQKNELEIYESVRVLGRVENLKDAYCESLFSIVPIFEGAGTKIKILESLAYGRTCVVSDHAYRGYSDTLKDRECLLRAKNDKEFSSACIRLIREEDSRSKMAIRGQERVKEKFRKGSFKRVVVQSIRAVSGRLSSTYSQ